MVVGGGKQPNLKIAKKSQIYFELEDGSQAGIIAYKGEADNVLNSLIGYAVAKYGKEKVISEVDVWVDLFNTPKEEK
tara:strand:- start:6690 stop:6920 length:231 start_codon:yes stop_codon:yes gene_type:complete